MVDGLCLFDLDPYGRELNAPLQELYQDLVHRLIEEPGSNLADTDRGVGLLGLVSASVNVSQITVAISNDLTKDARVHAVQTIVVPSSNGVAGSYDIAIQVQPDPTKLIAANGLPIQLTVNADGTYSEVTS